MSDVYWLALDELTTRWRPGSYPAPWTWEDEDRDIDRHDHREGWR